MKKIALFLAAIMLCTSTTAFAEDMGIQLIAGPDAEEEASTVDLDDFKIGDTAEIEGFGKVTILKADMMDEIAYNGYNSLSYERVWKSGMDADYLRLQVEVLNTQKKPVDFYKMIGTVTAEFDEEYQFEGWKRQYGEPGYKDNIYAYETKDESREIDPLYTGKYLIAVTLPNYVVESSEPLSVSFSIGDNEFTYYHRK